MRRWVYTHSVSHAHFLCTFSLRDVLTSRTRMAQGVCSAHVMSLHLALSIPMFHPPSLLFPHGHFDTTFPSAPSSSSFTRLESAGQAHFRTSAGEFGYLTDPTHSTDSRYWSDEIKDKLGMAPCWSADKLIDVLSKGGGQKKWFQYC